MAEGCDIGLIGLAVMGQNLVLNIESRGYGVAVFNRTSAVTDEFLAEHGSDRNLVGCHSIEDFVASLARPRKVMLMVKAGPAVDAVIEQLLPHLDQGDLIIDGGNSHFEDTRRRHAALTERGLLFIGTGVSGGEEGALKGPSMMPGGSQQAWPLVQSIFQDIAAKVGPNQDVPCCEWIGPDGAGHYVKMVHNGIEYGDMQLIGEAYLLLKQIAGLSNDELYDVFDQWNQGELDSYLIEITRDIFSVEDEETDNDLVDMVLDTAGSKGTGKWMSQLALDLGVPTTLITEAVYARYLSAIKDARVRASSILPGPSETVNVDRDAFIEQVRQALYAAKICSYAQGFFQLQAAAKEMNWSLDYGKIALVWRGGCIIRARFLDRIKEAFDADANLESLLLAPYFTDVVVRSQAAWREVVAIAVKAGIWIPALSAALTYYDGYRTARLPANLLQAQRDYFGAHTYKRTDREGTFHTDWLHLRRPPASSG